jgi:predicted regulator of Ras-like GTPase activity (Roadblock/LC7/MglB family)
VKEILARLCRLPGVRGALIVSGDGLLVAAETGLGDRAGEEAASAVIGSLCKAVSTTLERLERKELKALMISGDGARAAVATAGNAYLVALLESETNLGLIQLELGAAANEASRSISL